MGIFITTTPRILRITDDTGIKGTMVIKRLSPIRQLFYLILALLMPFIFVILIIVTLPLTIWETMEGKVRLW